MHHDSRLLEGALDLDSGSARIEVRCLLQEVLQVDHAWLLTHAEQCLDASQHARYMTLLKRRLGGEPIAYLLGKREFFGLPFEVSPATLIPRPETELLVELSLQRIPRRGAVRVLDLGTGSGVVALSIASARPNAEVVGVELSFAALEVAESNLRRLGLKNVRFLQGDWCSSLNGEPFDIIASNPPYIAHGDVHLEHGDVRFEPRSALVSGADGLQDIRRICAAAKEHLKMNGSLLLEHGYDQATRVRAILAHAGYRDVFSESDLSGIERVSGGSWAERGKSTIA